MNKLCIKKINKNDWKKVLPSIFGIDEDEVYISFSMMYRQNNVISLRLIKSYEKHASYIGNEFKTKDLNTILNLIAILSYGTKNQRNQESEPIDLDSILSEEYTGTDNDGSNVENDENW